MPQYQTRPQQFLGSYVYLAMKWTISHILLNTVWYGSRNIYLKNLPTGWKRTPGSTWSLFSFKMAAETRTHTCIAGGGTSNRDQIYNIVNLEEITPQFPPFLSCSVLLGQNTVVFSLLCKCKLRLAINKQREKKLTLLLGTDSKLVHCTLADFSIWNSRPHDQE